jgi:hypothetical protein
MAQRLLLHVGTIKSATTYLQAICDDNAALLAEHGVLWMGSVANFSAVADLYGVTRPDEYGAAAVSWPAFVERIKAHDGDVLVSNELLSFRSPKKVAQLVRSLTPTHVEVVVTARDFARVIVSQWQERVRHAPTGSWAEFADRLTAPDSRDDPELAWFWRRQDLPRLVETWATPVGVGSVAVVTVPRDAADALRERFFGLVGVPDPAQLTVPELVGNPSLGSHSVELVRRIQQRLDDDERGRLHLVLKYLLARRVLADRASGEPPLRLTADQRAWARSTAAHMAERLTALGVRVVGDLHDIVPDEVADDDPGGGSEPTGHDPSDAELLDAAVDALIGLADAADETARAVGGHRFGEVVRSVAGRGRPQP